jgi:chloramphenicol 3-O-phosphotransferase
MIQRSDRTAASSEASASHVVIINGPAGVGKTTVARRLQDLLPGTVCIHGDDIRAFAPADARVHLGPGSTYRAAAWLTNGYVEMNAPRVILDYIFENAQQIAQYRAGIFSGTLIHLFTVWAPLEIVQGREASRPNRERLGDRVVTGYRAVEANLAELGHVISNMRRPEDAAAEIHGVLHAWREGT